MRDPVRDPNADFREPVGIEPAGRLRRRSVVASARLLVCWFLPRSRNLDRMSGTAPNRKSISFNDWDKALCARDHSLRSVSNGSAMAARRAGISVATEYSKSERGRPGSDSHPALRLSICGRRRAKLHADRRMSHSFSMDAILNHQWVSDEPRVVYGLLLSGQDCSTRCDSSFMFFSWRPSIGIWIAI